MCECLDACTCTTCVQGLWKPEEAVGFPGTGDTDGINHPV